MSQAGTCAAAPRSSLEAVVGGSPRISGLILGFRPSQARSLPTSAAQLAGLAVPDVAGLIRSGVFHWPVRGAGRHSNHSEKKQGAPRALPSSPLPQGPPVGQLVSANSSKEEHFSHVLEAGSKSFS